MSTYVDMSIISYVDILVLKFILIALTDQNKYKNFPCNCFLIKQGFIFLIRHLHACLLYDLNMHLLHNAMNC